MGCCRVSCDVTRRACACRLPGKRCRLVDKEVLEPAILDVNDVRHHVAQDGVQEPAHLPHHAPATAQKPLPDFEIFCRSALPKPRPLSSGTLRVRQRGPAGVYARVRLAQGG